jgi:ubiquinone/menaquinone biosynthesis C-methylase UbiE
MSKLNNPDYLRNQQYKNSSNLNARINLHALFSTNPYGWFRWVFDHYQLFPGCQVLELGCGTGETWRENLARIPAGCGITLSDFSQGMLEQARQNLARQNLAGGYPFVFEVLDAQSIPFEDARFDIVIANHMLYHVPDRPRALAEIRRVLKPGRPFYATTIGEQHMQALFALPYRFDPQRAVDPLRTSNEFLLENGATQLQAFFAHVEMERYPDSLHVTEAEPLVDFILSSFRFSELGDRRAELHAFIEHELEIRGGAIDILKDSGIFISS